MHKDKIMSLGGTFNYIGKQIGRLYKYVSNFLKITIFGNSKQETTTGKNLLGFVDGYTADLIGFTNTISNQVWNISGAPTNTWFSISSANNALIVPVMEYGSTYRVLVKSTFPENHTVSLWFDNSQGEQIVTKNIVAAANTTTTDTFEFNSEEELTRFRVAISGFTIGNNYNGNIQIQITKGTNEEPYEPYTGGIASPNPDYPQEIEVIDELSIKVTGKNLLSDLLQSTLTYSGTTSKINGDNWEVIKSGTGGISINPRTGFVPFRLKNGEKITFSSEPYEGTMLTTSSTHYQIILYLYDENQELITIVRSGTTSQSSETTKLSTTYEATQDVYYIRLGEYIASNTGTTNSMKFHLQLEKGETSTSFKEYQETIYPIDLQGNTINKVGNIKDELVIDKLGNVNLVKKSLLYTLTGTEEINMRTDGMFGVVTPQVSYLTANAQEVSPILCNRLQSKPRDNVYRGTIGISYGSENNYYKNVCIRVGEDITTIEAFRTYVGTHNVEICYLLATSQTINLGKLPTPIKTKEGINNIELLTNIDTTFNVE